MAIEELPGALTDFIGRTTRPVRETFGLVPSGLKPEEELFGMNPRRAYWANALADLSQLGRTGVMGDRAMQGRAAQTEHMNRLKQQAQAKKYQDAIAEAGLLNAMRGKDSRTTLERNLEAAGYSPGTREFQDAMREAMKKGPLVDMGQDIASQYLEALPDAYQAASEARTDIGRYSRMLDLLPQLGETGPGKNAMVNFKGFLNALGMNDVANFIDGVSEIVGADFFSGDQGAAEFYRALNTGDVIGKARELYPVSDRDLQFLFQMTPALNLSDKRAMEAIIRSNIEGANRNIQYYDAIRSNLPEGTGTPLPEIPTYEFDTDDEYTRLKNELGM